MQLGIVPSTPDFLVFPEGRLDQVVHANFSTLTGRVESCRQRHILNVAASQLYLLTEYRKVHIACNRRFLGINVFPDAGPVLFIREGEFHDGL